MRLLGIDRAREWSQIETHLSPREDSCLSGYCLDQGNLYYTQSTCHTVEWSFFLHHGDRIWDLSLPRLPNWDTHIDRCRREGLDDDGSCLYECISTSTECYHHRCTRDLLGGVGDRGCRMERISRIGDIGNMCLDRIVLAYLDRLLSYSET